MERVNRHGGTAHNPERKKRLCQEIAKNTSLFRSASHRDVHQRLLTERLAAAGQED